VGYIIYNIKRFDITNHFNKKKAFEEISNPSNIFYQGIKKKIPELIRNKSVIC
jgi:hypothetical protein